MSDAAAGVEVEARGAGEPAVVLLPGALGRVELLATPLAAFARRGRTLAIGYGTTLRPDQLAEQIDAAIEREGCARVHLVGFSMGAMVALFTAGWLARKLESVVLVGGGAPDPARGARIARVLPLLRFMPAPLLRRRWRGELASAGLLARMSRRELVNLRARQAELDLRAPAFRPLPPETRVLRLDFERDTVISPAERARLAQLTPTAVVETLPFGHEATLTFPPALLQRIQSWTY